MNKNNLIKIAIREIQELETLTKNFSDKIDNLKSLIEVLQEDSQQSIVSSQQSIVDSQQSIVDSQESHAESVHAGADLQSVPTVTEPITAQVTNSRQQDKVVEKVEIIEEKPIVEEIAPIIIKEEKPEIVIEKEPEIVVEKAKPVVEKKAATPKKNILADTIKTTSLNEKLSEKATKSFDKSLSNQKITDLKRGISLNDKFRFQREIFGGNAALLNQTLEALNEMESKEEAAEFLSSLNFDSENPTVAEFLELVNRKFL